MTEPEFRSESEIRITNEAHARLSDFILRHRFWFLLSDVWFPCCFGTYNAVQPLMHYLLTPIGSSGDVYPFIGLGAELRRRGHRVTLITNGHFAPLARSYDLEFIELGDDALYRKLMLDPQLWHPTGGYAYIMKHVFSIVETLYEMLKQRIEPGNTTLIAHTLDFASRLLYEQKLAPLAVVQLSPVVFRTTCACPCPMRTLDINVLPRLVRRGIFWFSDRFLLDPPVCPPLNELRARLGLPPIHRYLKQWINRADLTIGMFPEYFGPRQPDWPANLHLTNFPLFDSAEAQGVPAELESFLQSGPPPVVFTPGSAVADAGPFLTAAIDACQRLSRRALLLTRFSHVPAPLPATIRHFEYAPLSRMLHRCAALVHHGGVGTIAAALAAGVPQVIMPMSFDQPDNAARVARLGIGDRLLPGSFTGQRLAQKLAPLLDSAPVSQRCQALARQTRSGIPQTCDLIEGMPVHILNSGALQEA